MIAGGAKLDCPTQTGEIYTSTLGLLFVGPTGPVLVTSGHAVGNAGSPIVLANGTVIGKVTHNAYLQGPMQASGESAAGGPPVHGAGAHSSPASPNTGGSSGGSASGLLPPPFPPAGPDVAVGSWSAPQLGLPLTVLLSIGAVTMPLPITGGQPPTALMPIKVLGADEGMRLGVVEQADASVTDAQTRAPIKGVAVARYASTLADAGAPILSLSVETHLPVIVGFHGGSVYEPNEQATPAAVGAVGQGPKSWFVPWPAAQQALQLPPFP